MSISSELLTLQNTKTAIRTAINNKGGSVGASDTFASYATAIDNLPSGGSGNPLLTSIDVSDFSGTTFNRATSYITDVTFPSGVTSIGNYAFQYCTGLTSITIPSGVTSIGTYAFQNCTGLTSLTLHTGSISIGNAAFNGCTALTSVNVSSLEDWFQKDFYMGTYDSYSSANPLTQSTATLYANGTAITGTLTIPNSVTTITGGSFNKYTKITSVNIHNSVTSIGKGAFYQCTGLTGKLTIPNSVTTINNSAFYGCTGLTSVEIGSGVTSFGYSILQGCTGLTSITITATTPPTLPSGSTAFDNTNNCPIYVPFDSVDTYKAASGWSTYASRIYPITQVATVDGNPVYNYDIGNKGSTTILSTEILKMPTGTSIEFAEGITNIGGQLGAYEDVTLPSTFTGFLDTQAINAATETLTSLATTPPTAERNNFGGAGLTAIYVPASAVDTYKAASGWSNFASIIQGLPSPTPSVTSITFAQYQEVTNPADWGEFEGCNGDVNLDAFPAASSSSTFDSDIKASGSILVEDNNGNDVTSQCTFSSNDYYKWDSTQDPEYDGESEAYYEWRLDTYIGDADAQNPQSATITATYGNLSDDFTIEWTTTSNCEEPEPEPEPDPEEPEE